MQVSTEMEMERGGRGGKGKESVLFPVTVCFVRVRERDMVVRKFFLASIDYGNILLFVAWCAKTSKAAGCHYTVWHCRYGTAADMAL